MAEVSHQSEAAALLISRAEGLLGASPVFAEIVNLDDAETIPPGHIADLLSLDPLLCDKVLQICNSDFLGFSGAIEDTAKAADVIGLHGMQALIIALFAIDVFDRTDLNEAYRDEFWRHSLLAAIGSRALMRQVRPGDVAAAESAFSAGILHDTGKLVMWMASASDGQEVSRRSALDPASELETECELFGCHHAEVGKQLAMFWALPDRLVRAIAYHHDPAACEDPLRLVDVLHMGDALAHHAAPAQGAVVAAPAVDPGVFDRTRLRLEAMGQYLMDLQSDTARTGVFLRIARRPA